MIGPENPMYRPRPYRPTRAHRDRGGGLVLLVIVLGAAAATGAVWTNALGAGEKWAHLVDRVELFLDPPSRRATVPTVEVTEPPITQGDIVIGGSGVDPRRPGASLRPLPPRKPIDFRIPAANPRTRFASQATNHWCNPAAVQIVLAMHGALDTSEAAQRRIAERLKEWETWIDAHAGGWGPASMAEALAAYGVQGYEVRAYKTRALALRDAAAALKRTKAPVLLIAWRGAHAWVMTGFRADADPTVFRDARVEGTYIFDPWYPRISTIWGPSDPPGTYQDQSEMQRNYLPWDRPEGEYAERDGKFLAVVPTIPLAENRPRR
jgi:hypothetical protein